MICSVLPHRRRLLRGAGFKGEIEHCRFLREKNNGIAAGMTEEEAKKHFCKPASEQELDHRNYPGGETRNEFYRRNVHGLWHCADVDKENLLIVAHKARFRILFSVGWEWICSRWRRLTFRLMCSLPV